MNLKFLSKFSDVCKPILSDFMCLWYDVELEKDNYVQCTFWCAFCAHMGGPPSLIWTAMFWFFLGGVDGGGGEG